VALEPAEGVVASSENSGLSYGTVAAPSLEPAVEARTIAVGEVGTTAALTRNPVDVRNITADNTKAIECASRRWFCIVGQNRVDPENLAEFLLAALFNTIALATDI
jgi:hypothetical protein